MLLQDTHCTEEAYLAIQTELPNYEILADEDSFF